MSQVFRRGQIKASITKFQTFLDEFTDSPLNQAKLQQRIENLKTVFKALPDITAQLMASNPDGDHATIETELTEVYMDVLAAATLLQHNYTETSNTRSVTPAISVASSNQNLDHNLSRMPKRELRKFDGKIEEWKSFSHWFKSNVHDRVGISDSTRMSYLQDTLVGEAASTIAGLEATNENYKEAWDLLETTYNNEEAIISRHFELLIAIPKIQNNTGESIRQLVNETLVHVRGMKVLGEPTDQWNTPSLYHTISKLDNTTKQEWYRRKVDKTKRNFDDLIDFLREEAMKIQTNTQNNNSNPTIKQNHMKNNYGSKLNQQKSKQVLTTVLFKNCPICEEDGHPTYKCKKLLKLTVPQRINTARKANLCLNCLRNNHHTNQCHRGNCFKCGKVHHTILHLEKRNNNDEEKDDELVVTSSSKTNSVVLLNRGKVEEIMVTALINILDKNNQPIRCRTLLDTAATSNLITESLAESLGLQKQKYSLAIGGLGDIQTSTSFKVKATIQSRFNNFERSLELYTVPEITKQHPNNYIDKRKLKLSDKINLADPTFNVPGDIDLLIGAGPALASFISGHKDMSTPEGPDLFLQNTQFGWVIGGAISLNNTSSNIKTKQKDITCHITTIKAQQQLTKTWAIEDGFKLKHLSEDERACEEHYTSHTTRNEDGSYVVALPFNSKQSLLKETRTRALNRFKSKQVETKKQNLPEAANIVKEGFYVDDLIIDASAKVYGAYVYLRWITTSREVQVNLLCTRSKVTPLQIQTLARLKLCEALMLANLFESIKELLPVQLSYIIFWYDSTITLSWIKTPPYQLKTFIDNRVSQTQTKTPITSWKHIRPEHNPADACSRRQTYDEFIKNILWRSGQHWLRYTEDQWRNSIISIHTENSKRKNITCLTTYIHESSKLKLLRPFIDEDGILRVGGRLNHANISSDKKHPILSQSHPYTTLIIEEAHHKHSHANTRTTLYAVRRKNLSLNSRNDVKGFIHLYIRCIKAKPKTATYPMGELPRERVTQTRPFYHTGVDYCGPFYIKKKKHRNRGKIKVYVAVLVCLAVKATHFEVVSNLTTDGFIAALRRFISRRGKCHTMHSDNGTNFIGVNNQLREIYQQIKSEENQSKVQRYLAGEAIEAILNSKPLTASSSDPNDPIAIAPGHFLIGDSLTSIPDWDWSDKPSNRLSSWQLIQKLKQAFWKRWHKEFLNGLNIRNKWQKGSHEIKEGSIVIIKENNTRPLHWPIGQIIQSHPGSDGIIRTLSIRTSHGVIDRNVRRLAILLPNDKPNESN